MAEGGGKGISCAEEKPTSSSVSIEESEEKKRKAQHCTFCKNHNVVAKKKGHFCPYSECTCPLCDLQRKAQLSMRHQQRVWRHQKTKIQKGTAPALTYETPEFLADDKGQVCDKCRNHNVIILKKGHFCPYIDCTCEYCSLTFKRRELMKRLQRVRRCKLTSDNITSKPNSTSWHLINGTDYTRSRPPNNEDEKQPTVSSDPNSTTFEVVGAHSSWSTEDQGLALGIHDVEGTSSRLASSPPPLLRAGPLVESPSHSSVPRTRSPPPLIPLHGNQYPADEDHESYFQDSDEHSNSSNSYNYTMNIMNQFHFDNSQSPRASTSAFEYSYRLCPTSEASLKVDLRKEDFLYSSD